MRPVAFLTVRRPKSLILGVSGTKSVLYCCTEHSSCQGMCRLAMPGAAIETVRVHTVWPQFFALGRRQERSQALRYHVASDYIHLG